MPGETTEAGCDPAALAERIGDGDVAAEAELVRRFSRPLMIMLQLRTGDMQRAEDIHQDTFCIVLERLRARGIEDPSRLAAFIHRTAINLTIGEFRKDARRRTHADSELIQRAADDGFDQLQQLIRREAGNAVREIVLQMQNIRDRELLFRFYILQEDKPVICNFLGLSPDHFDRVISRARKRFRKAVEDRRLMLVENEGAA